MFHNTTHRSFWSPRPWWGQANLSAVDEKLSCVPQGTLACHLGLLEQWPQLWFAHLLCGCEVFVQA
jgi:hypothetical protein